MHDSIYDTAIIGGGLAGLSLSILLAQKGAKVILFEKEQYPFHKVCGEYISLESKDFLHGLGLDIEELELPIITKLVVTAPDGTQLNQDLDLGGFGISRFTLDQYLKNIAEQKGVTVLENCKVTDTVFTDNMFTIKNNSGDFQAKVCCGCFGKRSNLDIRWKRPFVKQVNNKLSNYIGVKYHIRTKFPDDTIALHNFKNGYCGISRIEENKYCLCYLTNAQNLKESNNSIEEMEKNILSKNIYLKEIFERSEKLYQSPLSISQVSFIKKSRVENHVLLLGDAAGMITPLCGNGMSMAMHGAKIAAENIADFLQAKISRQKMEHSYDEQWKKEFSSRLRTGRIIQRFFGKNWTTNLFIKVMKLFPSLTKFIIQKTHGKPF
ncbi:NAD(P)/FAD-dependent oxidoreductase [Ferruginibacter sp. HRS2-29]|uniref:NAD(P)/FAD-dependent oxidoreductase n=1 Tax=Ferruginibacter sp. HRS2-29 TaxID=2487334 RepID=UPI0020CC1E79|nr:NAD(P)/FAD-dependent oxidoreductase [Ferruginibacter sp. HRS2-29]MCP9749766.1 NAD(P)/FAD-dependent oxidoreductase [Ferruginibacter sp. HRS2-29]